MAAISIKSALAKAQQNRKATPRGKALIQVSSIDEKNSMITGKIIDGTAVGDEITFSPGGHLDIKDYTQKKRTKVDIPGGVLRVEGLEKASGDNFKTRWCKTFQAKANDGQTLAVNQTFKLVPTRTKDKNGVQRVNLNVLDMEEETFTHDLDSFTKAIADAFEKQRAFTVMSTDENGEPFEFTYYRKGGYDEDGQYVLNPVDQEVERFFESIGDEGNEVLNKTLATVGVSVVPTRSIAIGSDTWRAVQDMIDEAKAAGKTPRGGNVDPADFSVTSSGIRFAAAVARLDSDDQKEAIKQRFFSFANDDMKAAFAEGGFAAISNSDMKAFLASEGVSILDPKSAGYATGAILTRPYNADNPDSSHMVTKTFGIYAATPFPKVEAFKDVRDRYYSEMENAVDTMLKAAPAKQAEAAPVKQAETKAVENPAAEKKNALDPGSVDDQHDIDALLDDIENGTDIDGKQEEAPAEIDGMEAGTKV